MSDKVIYLYPRNCSYTQQKEIYIRFHVAYHNASGPQKKALGGALVYFVHHWNVSLKAQSAWAMFADTKEGRL